MKLPDELDVAHLVWARKIAKETLEREPNITELMRLGYPPYIAGATEVLSHPQKYGLIEIEKVKPLVEALTFYRNYADCRSSVGFGECKCKFCIGDNLHRNVLATYESALKGEG